MIEHFQNDKSTVFSIAPFAVQINKPGIYPGAYKFDACKDENEPIKVVIGAAEHLKFIGGQKEPTREITPSFQFAKAVVDDFLAEQLWADPDCHPGMCWLQNDISLEEFKIKHKATHDEMKLAQRKWFVRLVDKTNDEWNKFHNSRVVSDPARFAVRYLGIETPEWMETSHTAETSKKCPACSSTNDARNAICTNCKCILDEAKFKTLKFA